MANLFDPAQSPTVEPETVVVGDFIQWRRTDLGSDYPNTAYTMTYVARITAGGNTEIQLAGTAYGSDYLFTVSSATSTNFVPGFYHWQLEAVRLSDSNRIVIDRGFFTAIPDLDVNGSDPRTHAEIMLAKIKSLLEGKADADVANYSIAGRSLTKLSFDELIKARDYYQEEYNKEVVAQRISKKQPTGATIKVRFL
jgi:hypothetical protein